MRHSIKELDGPISVRDARLAAGAIRAPALQLLGYAEHWPDPAAPLRAIAQHLLSLADDLQDSASAGGSQRLVIEPEHVAIGELARHVMASVLAMLGSRRHLRIAPEAERLSLQVDRRAMLQIFSQVMANAARFSLEDDWIDIDARLENDAVVLTLRDEGNPPSAGIGARSDRRGLGFGLVLSRQLMEAHGGSLAVDSAPGIGTCVTLNFPRNLLLSR